MAYESVWWRLSEAVTRVVEASGATSEETKIGICQGVVDRTINFRGKLGKHFYGLFGPGPEVGGKDFDLSASSVEFDWDSSRPKNPLLITHKRFGPRGYWHLDWIKLFGPDVMDAFGIAQHRGDSAQRPLSRPLPDAAGRATGEKLTERLSPRSDVSRASPGNAAPRRRRGRRPEKFERTVDAMRNDILQGRLPVAELANATEEYLAVRYGVSRHVVRQARDTVLSEFRGS
jgi:hypothetical protein